MSKTNTRATIDANIKQNGQQLITGQILNSVLNTIVTDYAEEEKVTELEREVGLIYRGEDLANNTILFDSSKVKGGDVAYIKVVSKTSASAVAFFDENNTRLAYVGWGSATSEGSVLEGWMTIPTGFSYAKIIWGAMKSARLGLTLYNHAYEGLNDAYADHNILKKYEGIVAADKDFATNEVVFSGTEDLGGYVLEYDLVTNAWKEDNWLIGKGTANIHAFAFANGKNKHIKGSVLLAKGVTSIVSPYDCHINFIRLTYFGFDSDAYNRASMSNVWRVSKDNINYNDYGVEVGINPSSNNSIAIRPILPLDRIESITIGDGYQFEPIFIKADGTSQRGYFNGKGTRYISNAEKQTYKYVAIRVRKYDTAGHPIVADNFLLESGFEVNFSKGAFAYLSERVIPSSASLADSLLSCIHGGTSQYPQNCKTLYKMAGKAGILTWETDVRPCADGYVLSHDNDLVGSALHADGTPLTSGEILCSSSSLSTLQTLKTGIIKNTTTIVRGFENDAILSLQEYLALAKVYGAVANIEIKFAATLNQMQEIYNIVKEYNMLDKVIWTLYGGAHQHATYLVQIDPSQKIIYCESTPTTALIDDAASFITDKNFIVASFESSKWNDTMISYAKSKGLRLGVWYTDATNFANFVNKGFFVIGTNYPTIENNVFVYLRDLI